MPIRKELRHLYRGPEWEALRTEVLARANNRCERCARPNNKLALATRDSSGRWNTSAAEALLDLPYECMPGSYRERNRISPAIMRGQWFALDELAEVAEIYPRFSRTWRMWHSPEKRPPYGAPAPDSGRIWLVKTSITVAHLDFNAENMAKENLGALCQRCHLKHDAKQHNAEARRTISARRGQLWLSDEIENATRPGPS